MKITLDIGDLGSLLKFWRFQVQMSTRDVAKCVSESLGQSVSFMTIDRYEKNMFPKSGPEPWLLVAIIEALEHQVSELPEEYQGSVRKLKELISRSTCFAKELLHVA